MDCFKCPLLHQQIAKYETDVQWLKEQLSDKEKLYVEMFNRLYDLSRSGDLQEMKKVIDDHSDKVK